MALLLTMIAFSIVLIILLFLTVNNMVSCGQSKVFLFLLLIKILFLLILVEGLSWFIDAEQSRGFPISRLRIIEFKLLELGFFGS